MENSFNLLDEPWIPVAGRGKVGLLQAFEDGNLKGVSGNPVEKIALMKLLLAIAQAAATPEGDEKWNSLQAPGLAKSCIAYMERWRDRFFLFGENPFLQMPAIEKAKVEPFGAVLPEIATGNTTVLSEIQVERALDDSEKAILLVTQMSLALGGKKADNTVVLSPGYQGKTNPKGKKTSGKNGPAMGYLGFLHSFLEGTNLQETIWLNMLTTRDIERSGMFAGGVGKGPWEEMPVGEDCPVAKGLKDTLMGRLIPLSRFCLLTGDGLHYSEGIAHLGFKDGVADPSIAVDYGGKDPKALWANPEKRPWRELTSLLSFFEAEDAKGFHCLQLRVGMNRIRNSQTNWVLWSGGLRVSSNAGEQYVSGNDDFVESAVVLSGTMFGATWFEQLKREMGDLDDVSRMLYGRVVAYYKTQNVDVKNGRKIAAQATHEFWQLCEKLSQDLVDSCESGAETLKNRHHLRRTFAGFCLQVFDRFCPQESARQLDAWAKCSPNLSTYLRQEV